MAAANNDKLLTLQVLETPAGNKVLETFFRELVSTKDIQGSGDKAKEVAEKMAFCCHFKFLPLWIY
jgi:hypothetical protein